MPYDGGHHLFEAMVESFQDPMLAVGADHRVIYLNPAARRMCGLGDGDMGGLSCETFLCGATQLCGGPECPVDQCFATGRRHFTFDPGGGDGRPALDILVTPLADDAGNIFAAGIVLRQGMTCKRSRTSLCSHQRFVHSSPISLLTFDANGQITEANPAALALFGKGADSLVGSRIDALLQPSIFSRCSRDGESGSGCKSFELSGVRANGEIFPANVSLASWQQEGAIYLTAIVEDISPRKKMEQAICLERDQLAEAQKKLTLKHEELGHLFHQVESAKREWEQSMDCIPDIVIIAGADQKILRVNRAIKAIVPRKFHDILGRPWMELLAAHGLSESGRFGADTEYWHAPSGNTYTLRVHEVKAARLQTTVVVTIHDITERKAIMQELDNRNRELNQHRQRLQRALDEVEQMIGRVIKEKDFGVYFSEAHALEKCWEVMQCEQPECSCYGKEAAMCWQVAGTHCGGEVQGVFAEKYGQCEKCKHYKQSMEDPVYQIGIQFNNMMKILETKNGELEAAYSELKATQSQILQQEKMASIGQLAAGVAHEINNPVGFITSNIGTLEKYMNRLKQYIDGLQELLTALDDQAAQDDLAALRSRFKIDFIMKDVFDLVHESLEGTERVKSIVMNLKNFSRVDQSAHSLADINECLESTLNIVWNEVKYKAVVRKEYGELPLTYCYPQQLNQVFMNLLLNAVQAIGEKGEISIRTRVEADDILIEVADTGCGIEAGKLNRIFEPFFTTKEVGKGTGLGLSIAYDIVTKQHHGEIKVESEVGRGSVFTVRIPVVEKKMENGI